MQKPNLQKQNENRKNFEDVKKEIDNCRTGNSIDYRDDGPDELRVYTPSIESVLILRDDGTWGLE